jgi:nitroimidazol reductase NimA-like FMN-containing flavoprotein (pyridoxamine 5'-phosphate oxidase superfamily)
MSEITMKRPYGDDPAVAARAVADANRYMTLSTADADGLPWASPVWFAAADELSELLWVSEPGARHSRNIAARPQVGVVIFDSQAEVGAAQALYASAFAEELEGDAIERGIALFAARSEEQGLRAWSTADVRAPARHRLYRATLRECFVLEALVDRRVAVPGIGTGG